jgi:hypothetical protein
MQVLPEDTIGCDPIAGQQIDVRIYSMCLAKPVEY